MTITDVPPTPTDVPGTTPSTPDRSLTGNHRITTAVVGGISIASIVLIGYPLLRVLTGVVWQDGRLSFEAVTETLALPELGTIILHTLIVVVCSVALAILVASVFAWLNERTDARMGALTDVLPIVNFLMPGIATATGWLLLLSPEAGYVNVVLRSVLNSVFGMNLTSGPIEARSWYTVIGVYTLTLVPFVYLVITAGLRNLDSRLEEQSRMCGASMWTTFRRVTLPALRPSLLSGMFLAVWFGFAIFSVPRVLAEPAGIKMVSVTIVDLLTKTYPARTAEAIGLSFGVLVLLAVIWVLQQQAIRSKRSAVLGAKGSASGRLRLGKWRPVARAFMLIYLASAVLLPLIALLLVTLNGHWGTIRWGELSVEPFFNALGSPQNRDAIVNSMVYSVTTATIATLVAAIIAWAAVSSPGRVVTIAAAVAKIPAAVPPIVIAVGIVLAVAGPPFFLGGTAIIVIAGYLVVAMPEASIISEAAAGQVGGELGQASQISGAGPLRTFRSIYLPLMAPGLMAGWTLIFVRIMADLEVSVLLASTNTPVIGFQLLAIFEGAGGYAELAAMALFVTLVSMTTVGVALSTTAAIHRRRNR